MEELTAQLECYVGVLLLRSESVFLNEVRLRAPVYERDCRSRINEVQKSEGLTQKINEKPFLHTTLHHANIFTIFANSKINLREWID